MKSNRKNWIRKEKEIAFSCGGRGSGRRENGLLIGGGGGGGSTLTWWWWPWKHFDMVLVAAEALRHGGGGRGSKTAEREVEMSKKERRERSCCEGIANGEGEGTTNGEWRGRGHCEWRRRGRGHCEGGRRRRKGNGKREEWNTEHARGQEWEP